MGKQPQQADLPAATGARVRPPSWRQRLHEYEEDGVVRCGVWLARTQTA